MWSRILYQSLLSMLGVETSLPKKRRDQPLIDRIRMALQYLKVRMQR